MKEAIKQIDTKLKSGELKEFPSTANRLIKIRGKLLHRDALSHNDLDTLLMNNIFNY